MILAELKEMADLNNMKHHDFSLSSIPLFCEEW
jgi:hypothetical protein